MTVKPAMGDNNKKKPVFIISSKNQWLIKCSKTEL